jgi:hypothetical protein
MPNKQFNDGLFNEDLFGFESSPATGSLSGTGSVSGDICVLVTASAAALGSSDLTNDTDRTAFLVVGYADTLIGTSAAKGDSPYQNIVLVSATGVTTNVGAPGSLWGESLFGYDTSPTETVDPIVGITTIAAEGRVAAVGQGSSDGTSSAVANGDGSIFLVSGQADGTSEALVSTVNSFYSVGGIIVSGADAVANPVGSQYVVVRSAGSAAAVGNGCRIAFVAGSSDGSSTAEGYTGLLAHGQVDGAGAAAVLPWVLTRGTATSSGLGSVAGDLNYQIHAVTGTANTAGTSTVTSAAQSYRIAAGTLSGASSTSVSGIPVRIVTGDIAGDSDATLAPDTVSAPPLAGLGVLTSSPQASYKAAGTLAGVGAAVVASSNTFQATTSVIGLGLVAISDAAISGITLPTGAFAGTSTVVADAWKWFGGVGTLTGTSTLTTMSPVVTRAVNGSTYGNGFLNADASVGVEQNVVSGTASATAVPEKTGWAEGGVPGVGRSTGAGSLISLAIPFQVVGTGSLAGTAIRYCLISGSSDSTSTVESAGIIVKPVTGDIGALGDLVGEVVVVVQASACDDGYSDVYAETEVSYSGEGSLDGSSGDDVTGWKVMFGDISGDSSIDGDTCAVYVGEALDGGQSSAWVEAEASICASSVSDGAGSLLAESSAVYASGADADGAGTIYAEGIYLWTGSSVSTGEGTLDGETILYTGASGTLAGKVTVGGLAGTRYTTSGILCGAGTLVGRAGRATADSASAIGTSYPQARGGCVRACVGMSSGVGVAEITRLVLVIRGQQVGGSSHSSAVPQRITAANVSTDGYSALSGNAIQSHPQVVLSRAMKGSSTAVASIDSRTRATKGTMRGVAALTGLAA